MGAKGEPSPRRIGANRKPPAAYEVEWMSRKPATVVESLGIERVREILAGNGKAAIEELMAKDRAVEPEFTAITDLDRLVRYHRDLITLLKNFVSFSDFYTRKDKALFQAGVLYLDSRSCDLCIRVDDIAKHASLATMSQTYLAYCHCTRKNEEGYSTEMDIAAAFTDGDADCLMPGRNGVFYDRQGRDWDATIVKVIEHPISIRQAFWSPYKRIARMINEQIEKMAASRDKDVADKARPASPTAPKNRGWEGGGTGQTSFRCRQVRRYLSPPSAWPSAPSARPWPR